MGLLYCYFLIAVFFKPSSQLEMPSAIHKTLEYLSKFNPGQEAL